MKNNIKIILIGDSIIKRGDWKNLLEINEVLNLGVDGDTTLGVYNRLDAVVSLNPKFLFLQVGVNDLCLSNPTIDESIVIYKKILQKLKETKIKIIVHAVFFTQMPAINKKIKKFNLILKEHCQLENIEFLDINEYFLNKKGLLKEELTTDGLHLGQKAYKAWSYKILRNYLDS